MPAILNTHGCNYRILATPPSQHAPFWLPSSQCSHPLRPMAAMAVSQPSARPQDGCHTAVAAIWPEDGCREFDPAFSPPRHEPRWLHSRSASHHTLFWMAGVVISQPSRWNAWSGSSKLSHPPADGCDGCMTAILRPGGWLGHSHPSQPSAGGWLHWLEGSQNGACCGRAEWLGSCNCSHAY